MGMTATRIRILENQQTGVAKKVYGAVPIQRVKPKPTDVVQVNYKGSLLDGTVFDDSERHGGPAALPLASSESLQQAMDRYQRELIQNALAQHGGKWAAAARALAIDPSNLRKLARRLGVKV